MHHGALLHSSHLTKATAGLLLIPPDLLPQAFMPACLPPAEGGGAI